MHTQYHNGYYLLQLENDNYAVVDSNFNRHREFEQLLANTKTSYIYRRNDSTILSTEVRNFQEKEFYLTNDLKLIPCKGLRTISRSDSYGHVYLEDSTYHVYGGCLGFYGGVLLFYNKANKRLYFYKACSYQVVHFHNSFYVFDGANGDSITRISYPERLNELQYTDRHFSYSLWMKVNGLDAYKKNSGHRLAGVVKYKANYKERYLNTFVYNDTLFTIVSTDSSTYLAMHQGDSLKAVQTLLNKGIRFNESKYYDDAGRRIISFSYQYLQSADTTQLATQFLNSGFVIIQGRKIDIAEYPRK